MEIQYYPSMKKELTNEQSVLLLSSETEYRFGYKPEDLSYGSKRKIVHKCVICQKPKETQYKLFLQNKNISHVECKSQRVKQNNLQKYGVESTTSLPKVKEKREKTCIDRYGADYLQQVHQKARQTCLKKYGVEHPFQSPEIQQKVEQTNLEHRGTKRPFQSPEVQQKIDQIILEKYGVNNPFQSATLREKYRQTCLSKYGVEWPLQLEQTHAKRRQTNFEKYGVEDVAKLPENRDKLKNWCIENPEKLYSPKSEIELLNWVKSFYLSARKYRDGSHEIDVFIPDINLGIEHNGLFYHQESRVGQNYHINKTKYFEAKNIRILHIFEHEWKNRQGQVKSFLQSAMGKNEHKIGARKCALQWSSSLKDIKEVHKFLEDYHIQGQPMNTKYVVKVLYNNDLLAVATFGKHHRNNSKDSWVLTRFCTKTNYTIQGVLSRISKLASQQIKEDIVSWADYRLSQGNGYEKAGWVFEELLPPDYFYHRGLKVFSKQSRQKRTVNTPEGMTERQHAKQDGLERVYDCGKIRYKYIYKDQS
jgi:hypothetical protein